jgi:hypothetical protein
VKSYFTLRVALLFTCPFCGVEQSVGLHHAEGVKCTAAHCMRCREGLALVLKPVTCVGCPKSKKYVCNNPKRIVIVSKIYDHEIKKEII